MLYIWIIVITNVSFVEFAPGATFISLSLFLLNKTFLQDLSATQISTKLSLPKNG